VLENILTVIGLALLLVAAYFVGRVLNQFKHRRFIQAWQPIQPVIDGTVHEDPGGGGASSWLVGRWKGRTIHARMTPDVRSGSGDSYSHHENRFAVGVADLKGTQDWSVGPSRGTLALHSDDPLLAERLVNAGALRLVENAGSQTARYSRHERALFLEEDVRPAWIPTEARFRLLLDTAVDLARAHENAAVGRALK
jgi:hypothetical protein